MIGLKARVQTKQCWRPGPPCFGPRKKKARRWVPEKGTTPESGGGTATMSRVVVTAATLAPLADSQPPRRLCKKENRDTQAVPPQSLERVRQAPSGQPPAMTGGVLIAVWLRWTRARQRRAEAVGRTFVRQPLIRRE